MIRRFLFFIAIVLIAAALAPPAHAQWWKKEREKSRLDEQVVHPGGRSAARFKWDDGAQSALEPSFFTLMPPSASS